MQKRRQQSMRPIWLAVVKGEEIVGHVPWFVLSEGNYFTGKVSRLPTNL